MSIFGKKEEAVGKLLEEHLIRVERIVQEFETMYQCYLLRDHDYKEGAGTIDRIEHEADTIRREIMLKLAGGAFLPIHREDYMRLAEHMDDVANATEEASKFLALTRPFLPDFLRDDFSAIVRETVEMIGPLRELLRGMNKKTDVVFALCEEIEQLEKSIDQREAILTKKLFKSDLRQSIKLHLKLLLDRIADVSDIIEDISDRVQVMTIKRPT